MENKQLQLKESAKQIDTEIASFINDSKALGGFERSLRKAEIVAQISTFLDSSNQMESVMKMQNKQYGFRTDSDTGYLKEVVQNCLIEAALRGVEPTGNMFNILGGNCYITKEGCKHILKNRLNIAYRITQSFSKEIKPDFWVVPCRIEWNGNKKDIDIPVTVHKNKQGGIVTKEDARKGMAERDAMAWLIEEITSLPMSVGQTEDSNETIEIEHEVISKATQEQQIKFDKYISRAENLEDLDARYNTSLKSLEVEDGYFNMDNFNEIKKKLTPTISE